MSTAPADKGPCKGTRGGGSGDGVTNESAGFSRAGQWRAVAVSGRSGPAQGCFNARGTHPYVSLRLGLQCTRRLVLCTLEG